LLKWDLVCWCWWDTEKPSRRVKGIKKSTLRRGGESKLEGGKRPQGVLRARWERSELKKKVSGQD